MCEEEEAGLCRAFRKAKHAVLLAKSDLRKPKSRLSLELISPSSPSRMAESVDTSLPPDDDSYLLILPPSLPPLMLRRAGTTAPVLSPPLPARLSSPQSPQAPTEMSVVSLMRTESDDKDESGGHTFGHSVSRAVCEAKTRSAAN